MEKRLRFPSPVDLLALIGAWFVLQMIVTAVMFFVMDIPDLLPLLQGKIEATSEQSADLGRFHALTYFFSSALMLVAVVLYRRLRNEGGRTPLRFSWKGLDPKLLLWGLVMMLAAGVVIEPLVQWLPDLGGMNMGRGFWTIVTLVFLAPVFEELICRGIVLESAKTRYGTWPAIFLSAAFFGVLHLAPQLVVNAFVIGLILGYIYVETGSLLSVMCLHALNNALAYVLMMLGLEDESMRSVIAHPTLYGVVYGIALTVLVVSGYLIWRRLSERKKSLPLQG